MVESTKNRTTVAKSTAETDVSETVIANKYIWLYDVKDPYFKI